MGVSGETVNLNLPEARLSFHLVASVIRFSVSLEVGGVDAEAKKSLSKRDSIAHLEIINLGREM